MALPSLHPVSPVPWRRHHATRGPPAALLDAAWAGRFEIVASPALRDELRRVLRYPKLQVARRPDQEPDTDECLEAIQSEPSLPCPAARNYGRKRLRPHPHIIGC